MDKKEVRSFTIGEMQESGERTIEASLSSEFPVQRSRGKEILSHAPGAVDLSRAPLPLVIGHDVTGLPVGVVEGLRVEGGKLRGSLRFGESARAQEVMADVKAGILRNLSVGYLVQATERAQGDSYKVTRWLPYECSLVAAPADPTIGVGRSMNTNTPQEGTKMDMNDIRQHQTRIMAELGDLAASGSDAEALEAKKRELADLDTRLAVMEDLAKRKGGNDKVPPLGAPAGTAPIRDGEVRILAPGDKLADTCRRDLPEGIRADELSLGRAIRAMVLNDWSDAKAERAVMVEATSGLGGVLVPEPMSATVLDLARNSAVVMQAGASTVPMTSSTLKLCKTSQDVTAYWRAEGEAITASDMAFEPMTLTAKVLAALVTVSIELIEDAANVQGLIEASIASALGLELDRVALFGSGVGAEPLGLFGAAGVQAVDMGATAGAALTNYDPFIVAQGKLLDVNAIPGAIVMAPRTATSLALLKDTTNQPLVAPASYASAVKLTSNQIPVDLTHGTAHNASVAFTGAWSDLLVGMRTGLTLEASRVAGADAFAKMLVQIRCYLRADIAVARSNHFAMVKGIIPAA
ncbi:Phage capsid family protein [anaerobic digester metagenome]